MPRYIYLKGLRHSADPSSVKGCRQAGRLEFLRFWAVDQKLDARAATETESEAKTETETEAETKTEPETEAGTETET